MPPSSHIRGRASPTRSVCETVSFACPVHDAEALDSQVSSTIYPSPFEGWYAFNPFRVHMHVHGHSPRLSWHHINKRTAFLNGHRNLLTTSWCDESTRGNRLRAVTSCFETGVFYAGLSGGPRESSAQAASFNIMYDEFFLKHRPPPGHPHPECPARVSTARTELDDLEVNIPFRGGQNM